MLRPVRPMPVAQRCTLGLWLLHQTKRNPHVNFGSVRNGGESLVSPTPIQKHSLGGCTIDIAPWNSIGGGGISFHGAMVVQVRSRSDVYGRNEQLLDCVCRSGLGVSEMDEFLNALKQTDQQHVVNYILHNAAGQFHRQLALYSSTPASVPFVVDLVQKTFLCKSTTSSRRIRNKSNQCSLSIKYCRLLCTGKLVYGAERTTAVLQMIFLLNICTPILTDTRQRTSWMLLWT